jgi:hypothetical protein
MVANLGHRFTIALNRRLRHRPTHLHLVSRPHPPAPTLAPPNPTARGGGPDPDRTQAQAQTQGGVRLRASVSVRRSWSRFQPEGRCAEPRECRGWSSVPGARSSPSGKRRLCAAGRRAVPALRSRVLPPVGPRPRRAPWRRRGPRFGPFFSVSSRLPSSRCAAVLSSSGPLPLAFSTAWDWDRRRGGPNRRMVQGGTSLSPWGHRNAAAPRPP